MKLKFQLYQGQTYDCGCGFSAFSIVVLQSYPGARRIPRNAGRSRENVQSAGEGLPGRIGGERRGAAKDQNRIATDPEGTGGPTESEPEGTNASPELILPRESRLHKQREGEEIKERGDNPEGAEPEIAERTRGTCINGLIRRFFPHLHSSEAFLAWPSKYWIG